MTLDGILVAGIVLTARCLALVRLTIWARLGSILGFLAAGVVLGPNTPGFPITTHVDQLPMIGELVSMTAGNPATMAAQNPATPV